MIDNITKTSLVTPFFFTHMCFIWLEASFLNISEVGQIDLYLLLIVHNEHLTSHFCSTELKMEVLLEFPELLATAVLDFQAFKAYLAHHDDYLCHSLASYNSRHSQQDRFTIDITPIVVNMLYYW